MTIRLAAPFALLALSCAGAAVAVPPNADHATHAGSASGQTTDGAAKPDKQRKICRSEAATGSVMPKRVCRTVAQIEEDQRNAERFREQENRSGASAR
jgi:hypothetical protein